VVLHILIPVSGVDSTSVGGNYSAVFNLIEAPASEITDFVPQHFDIMVHFAVLYLLWFIIKMCSASGSFADVTGENSSNLREKSWIA